MFSNALMDMSFYAANCYLEDMQNRRLEQDLDEITDLVRRNCDYCVKVRIILQSAVSTCVDVCCGKDGWSVVHDEGEHPNRTCLYKLLIYAHQRQIVSRSLKAQETHT